MGFVLSHPNFVRMRTQVFGWSDPTAPLRVDDGHPVYGPGRLLSAFC
jgi:hypothetical protein